MARAIERHRYLALLGNAMEQTDWRCLAYCLMGDHLQFAMLAGKQPLESWAKRVNSPYAHGLNRHRERRGGAIFAERPTVRTIANDRALELLAFVHNGPVRAGFVPRSAGMALSSHRAYIGVASAPPWLCVAEGLRVAGFTDRPGEFDAAVDDHRGHDLPPAEPTQTPAFNDNKRVSTDQVVSAVLAAFGLPPRTLHIKHIRGDGSDAKRVAIHVARECQISLADMAAVLEVTRQRASQVAATTLDAEHRGVVDEIVAALLSETDRAG